METLNNNTQPSVEQAIAEYYARVPQVPETLGVL